MYVYICKCVSTRALRTRSPAPPRLRLRLWVTVAIAVTVTLTVTVAVTVTLTGTRTRTRTVAVTGYGYGYGLRLRSFAHTVSVCLRTTVCMHTKEDRKILRQQIEARRVPTVLHHDQKTHSRSRYPCFDLTTSAESLPQKLDKGKTRVYLHARAYTHKCAVFTSLVTVVRALQVGIGKGKACCSCTAGRGRALAGYGK